MKIVLFGANGFVGSRVLTELSEAHNVVTTSYSPADTDYQLDLADLDAIVVLLKKEQPEVIVNCAGMVDRGEKARLNVVFTTNICEAVKAANLRPKKIIVSGSAAEYGEILPADLPVSEGVPINAAGYYAESKADETATAQRYGRELGVQVVVARIFNPLGAGMPAFMLLPNLIRQAAALKDGQTDTFKVSRLEAKRDYVDVRDVARAFRALIEAPLQYSVYNVGSGVATTNAMIIKTLEELFDLPGNTKVHETASEPETLVACQADITRIEKETGWTPQYSLQDTLRGVLHESC